MLISHLTVIEVVEMDRIITDAVLESHCRRLSHGGHSGMNNALDHYKLVRQTDPRPIDAKGIFAKYAKNYIAWALWTRETDNYSFKPAPGKVAFQIYVQHEYRRKGIGTKLFDAAQKLVQPNELLHVYYISNPGFFNPLMEAGLCGDVYK